MLATTDNNLGLNSLFGDFLVSVDKINGKRVINAEGFNLGEVKGTEADLSKWQITHLQIKLSDRAAEELGFKKRFRSSTVCMPVSIVNSIGDVVTTNSSLSALSNNPDIIECRE